MMQLELAEGGEKHVGDGTAAGVTGEAADVLPSLAERLAQSLFAIEQSAGRLLEEEQASGAKKDTPQKAVARAAKPAAVPAKVEAPIVDVDTAKDVVLCMSMGVHDANLGVMLGTLRKVSAKSTIVVFTDSPSENAKALISKHNAQAIAFDKSKLPSIAQNFKPLTMRWFLYRDFLREKKTDFTRVMLADASDTAFQSSPFSMITSPGLYLANEGEIMKAWDEGKVRQCFGDDVANPLGDRPVLSSASIIGSSSAVSDLLERHTNIMYTEEFVKCENAGDEVDAGALNVVLQREGGLAALFIQSPEDGPIAVLGSNRATVQAANIRVVLKKTGEAPKVVHEYDRDKALLQGLIKMHAPFLVHTEAAGTAACEGFRTLGDIDGFGDLAGPERAFSFQECCTLCNGPKIKGCKGFTFLSKFKQCWLKNSNAPNRNGPAIPGATSAWRQ